MLEADRLLIACPRCGAWPMSANVANTNWARPGKISFRCPGCGHQESAPMLTSKAASQGADA